MSQLSTVVASTPSKLIRDSAVAANASAPPSPGTFRHPRLTEIIQRQSASSLTGRKVQNAGINLAALSFTLVFSSAIHNLVSQFVALASVQSAATGATTLILTVRLLLCLNIVLCLRPAIPYISRKDDVNDIPLTPSQRALLGLPPSPALPSGSPGYITPPRYKHDGGVKVINSAPNSPTALSTGGRSISANYSASPSSTSRYNIGFSPSPHHGGMWSTRSFRYRSDSPFASSADESPSAQLTFKHEFNQSTFTTINGRSSLGTSTSSMAFGLSRSQSLRERRDGLEHGDSVPSTPSPSGPKRQPGMNYKWLYDKGARMSQGERIVF